jgi:methionine-rich copper-binding protein CopC
MAVRLLTMAPLGTALASPAFAHAFLEQANRSAGSQLRGSPSAVTMTFTAQVEPRFSLIESRDVRATRMDTGPVHLGDGKSITVDVQLLPAGIYTVNWQATSVDTHKTRGRFELTVRP